MVQKGKVLPGSFLPGEENMVRKPFTGACEGDRAVARWAPLCSCMSGVDLKGRAWRLGLNHCFFNLAKQGQISPAIAVGPEDFDLPCEGQAGHLWDGGTWPCLWCPHGRVRLQPTICAFADVRLHPGGNSLDWSLALLGSWLNVISKGEESQGLRAEILCSITSGDICYFPFFSPSKN